jgi:hypothetical protein
VSFTQLWESLANRATNKSEPIKSWTRSRIYEKCGWKSSRKELCDKKITACVVSIVVFLHQPSPRTSLMKSLAPERLCQGHNLRRILASCYLLTSWWYRTIASCLNSHDWCNHWWQSASECCAHYWCSTFFLCLFACTVCQRYSGLSLSLIIDQDCLRLSIKQTTRRHFINQSNFLSRLRKQKTSAE